MKILTKEEIQRFLIQAKAEGMYELFLLELTTGMRRGEPVPDLGYCWLTCFSARIKKPDSLRPAQ